MAGIGVRLNKIFSKNTIATNLMGFGYSTVVTIAPMLLVITAVLIMEYLLDFSKVGYIDRELFSCTLLYIFIFGLLAAAPFNAVLSKYMSDVIYNETYADIIPCYYIGLFMNVGFGLLMAVPFCIHEYIVGKVPLYYVFTGFCGFICLVLVFYSMLYLSICKDYKRISEFFLIGMLVTIILSLVLNYLFKVKTTYAMLLSITVGFFLIAVLELSLVFSYFRENSGKYRDVLQYFKKYWPLVGTNFLYTIGLYMHNFVFWTTDDRMTVVKSFVCMQPYDMATCLAMFTNISASVIFIARVEMNFHERYKAYSEAVIGQRAMDIDNAKKRMFRQLGSELMNLIRIQFIVTVILFILFLTFMPDFGFSGLVTKIYPCLTAGYFILFSMYAEIIFLYYFSDLKGSLATALSFAAATLIGSIFATHLTPIWYGIGLVIGALTGWTVAYFRLRYIEKHLDRHIFCNGRIMKAGDGPKPDNCVFNRYSTAK